MATIHHGNNIDILKTYPDNHFDSIVTDPPYGIEFLGKDWDKNTGAIETWQECLRVLKPGGHLLAFSAARTYHHLASNIESVGFEVRDQLIWLYASGFPKAQDIGKSIERRETNQQSLMVDNSNNTYAVGVDTKCPNCNKTGGSVTRNGCNTPDCPIMERLKPADNEWAGWKTALKPAHEPVVMARKPFKGSTIDNVLEHGVGALNIDATRIPYENEKDLDTYLNNIAGPMERSKANDGDNIGMHEGKTGFKVQKGKVKRPQGGANGMSRLTFGEGETSNEDSFKEYTPSELGRYPSNVLGEVQGYQKYFYSPKVSRAERHTGFDKDSLGAMIDANTHGKTPLCLDCNKTFNGSNNHSKCDPAKKTFVERRNNYEQTGTLKRMKDKMHQPQVGNNHPTVKPVELMKYLVRLVTPKNGVVLDPFMGSGSTGMACKELKLQFVGVEQDANYVDIASTRIKHWQEPENQQFNELFEEF